jgi:hypothetical protein
MKKTHLILLSLFLTLNAFSYNALADNCPSSGCIASPVAAPDYFAYDSAMEVYASGVNPTMAQIVYQKWSLIGAAAGPGWIGGDGVLGYDETNGLKNPDGSRKTLVFQEEGDFAGNTTNTVYLQGLGAKSGWQGPNIVSLTQEGVCFAQFGYAVGTQTEVTDPNATYFDFECKLAKSNTMLICLVSAVTGQTSSVAAINVFTEGLN